MKNNVLLQGLRKKNKARLIAIDVLLQVSPNNFAQRVLDVALNKNALSARDRGLTTELVYGTLRYYIRAEYLLTLFLPNIRKLPNSLVMSLRMAVYEILVLNRIPNYATVDFAVEFVKSQFGNKLSNLANATLHNILELDGKICDINFYKKNCYYFSVLPWMYGYLNKSYGLENTHRLLNRFLERPKMCIRLNKKHNYFKNFHNDFSAMDGIDKVGDKGFVFKNTIPIKINENYTMKKAHIEGVFSWQTSGSQEAINNCIENFSEIKNYPLWDACAGQGGKTTALLEEDINVHLASDINFERLLLLKENTLRLGLPTPALVCSQAESSFIKFDFLEKNNSTILLDVPCSGFGTLAKKPEIRIFRSYEDVLSLINLQQEILQRTFKSLRVGQFIIYMTCTLNPHENEKQIELLLKNEKSAHCIYSWQTPLDYLFFEGMFFSVIIKK